MYEVPFIQEVPDINTSPFLDTDELKMALLAQKGFRGLWRNGPCPVTSFPLEGFGEGGGGGGCVLTVLSKMTKKELLMKKIIHNSRLEWKTISS